MAREKKILIYNTIMISVPMRVRPATKEEPVRGLTDSAKINRRYIARIRQAVRGARSVPHLVRWWNADGKEFHILPTMKPKPKGRKR